MAEAAVAGFVVAAKSSEDHGLSGTDPNVWARANTRARNAQQDNSFCIEDGADGANAAQAAATEAAEAVLSLLAVEGAFPSLTRLASKLQGAMQRDALTSPQALEEVVGPRALEAVGVESFAAVGARGRWRYAANQLLSVRVDSGEWVDVEVAPPAEDAEAEDAAEAAEAEVAEAEEAAASPGMLHSLHCGPLQEGWVQLTHGKTANARRYALVWADRIDVHSTSGGGGHPTLSVPLSAATGASLAAGGTRLTILNGAVEVRLMAAASEATKMHAWHEALQRAISGAASERLRVGLHPWNHAPRELPRGAFEAMRVCGTATGCGSSTRPSATRSPAASSTCFASASRSRSSALTRRMRAQASWRRCGTRAGWPMCCRRCTRSDATA